MYLSRQVRVKIVAKFNIKECINPMENDSKKLLAFIHALSLLANSWNQQTLAKHIES